jgi:hypothetical protein
MAQLPMWKVSNKRGLEWRGYERIEKESETITVARGSISSLRIKVNRTKPYRKGVKGEFAEVP